MIDYSRRSYNKEILDKDDIPFADIQQTMKELDFINTYLGGHSITISGCRNLSFNRKDITICEIGCGGGDNLNAIYKWSRKKNVEIDCTGIDINADCITYAKKNTSMPAVIFITSDYRKIKFENKPDIIFSSLFCHHFNDEELVNMIKWMKENCTVGFFINDLHRHRIAYHFIKFMTSIFSKSYLVKNDGPLSVLRGFKKSEWINILQKAKIENYTVRWKWAFRHLIICFNG